VQCLSGYSIHTSATAMYSLASSNLATTFHTSLRSAYTYDTTHAHATLFVGQWNCNNVGNAKTGERRGEGWLPSVRSPGEPGRGPGTRQRCGRACAWRTRGRPTP
jgi:hypothetical protein